MKKYTLIVFILIGCSSHTAEQSLQLLHALKEKDFVSAIALLQDGALPDYQADDGASPLHEALTSDCSIGFYEKMLGNVRNRSALNKQYGNPPSSLIMYAAHLKKPYLLEALLKAGASCNIRDNQGNSILYALRDYDEQELPDTLLPLCKANEYNCNMKNNSGRTIFDDTLADQSSLIKNSNRLIFLKKLVTCFQDKLSSNTIYQARDALDTLCNENPGLKNNRYITQLSNAFERLRNKNTPAKTRSFPIKKTTVNNVVTTPVSPRSARDPHARRYSIEIVMPAKPLPTSEEYSNPFGRFLQTPLMEAVLTKEYPAIPRLSQQHSPTEIHCSDITPLSAAFRAVCNFLNNGDLPGERRPFRNTLPFVSLRDLLHELEDCNKFFKEIASLSLSSSLDGVNPLRFAFETLRALLKSNNPTAPSFLKTTSFFDACKAIAHFSECWTSLPVIGEPVENELLSRLVRPEGKDRKNDQLTYNKEQFDQGKYFLTAFRSKICVQFLAPLLTYSSDRSVLNRACGPDGKLLYTCVLACRQPHARHALLQLLIKQKLDVNARDKNNNGILDSIDHLDPSDGELLLTNDFDPNISNAVEETPVSQAAKNRWFEIITLYVNPENKKPLLHSTVTKALAEVETPHYNDGSLTERGETISSLLRGYLRTSQTQIEYPAHFGKHTPLSPRIESVIEED